MYEIKEQIIKKKSNFLLWKDAKRVNTDQRRYAGSSSEEKKSSLITIKKS